MSFVLTVWEMPAGAPAPADDSAADALLARQRVKEASSGEESAK